MSHAGTLTARQRERLLRNFIASAGSLPEMISEEAWYLLETAPAVQSFAIVHAIGWARLAALFTDPDLQRFQLRFPQDTDEEATR